MGPLSTRIVPLKCTLTMTNSFSEILAPWAVTRACDCVIPCLRRVFSCCAGHGVVVTSRLKRVLEHLCASMGDLRAGSNSWQ